MKLTLQPHSYQTLLATDSRSSGDIDHLTLSKCHALGTLELRSRLFAVGRLQYSFGISVGSHLQFIVDRCCITIRIREYGRIQINQYASQIRTDTRCCRITVFPGCHGIIIATGIIEYLVMLVFTVKLSDLLDIVPLADDAVDRESFLPQQLRYQLEHFFRLLLDTEINHIAMETSGKQETAAAIYQYHIRECPDMFICNMVSFIRRICMSLQYQTSVQWRLGYITQHRFMVPIVFTYLFTQHYAARNILFIIIRHAEKGQPEYLFVLR